MLHSTDRILTTHTGSLPRPSDLLPLITAAEAGDSDNVNRLQTRVRAAVAEIVRKQIDAGVDIVNDGEASKPSYSTYVKDRLTGFHGEADVMAIADLADYPEFGERFARQGVLETLKRPACTAPITYKDLDAVNRDIADLKGRGVLINGEIQEMPWGRFVTFDDPDGNGIVLQATTPGS